VDNIDTAAPLGSARRERDWLRESWDELAALTQELDLDPQQMRMLELRWMAETRHYDALWRRQRTRNDVLSVVTIVAGLAAPVLVAVDAPDWALAVAGFVGYGVSGHRTGSRTTSFPGVDPQRRYSVEMFGSAWTRCGTIIRKWSAASAASPSTRSASSS
jgi:hypothetical protein